ncbi:MAG TPA: hypothetical protein VG848_04555 [Acetobacteraceae bacterium]|jgi:hypothetical protein|nr:hypothetical protein [Acetobacteraceae bacterium]
MSLPRLSPPRRTWGVIAACLSAPLWLCPHGGLAQAKGVVLVTSGDWVAMEQRDSPTAPAYICSAFTQKNGRLFELQMNIVDTEIFYADAGWSAPEDVPATLHLAVGGFRTTLNVSDDTNNVAVTAIATGQLLAMISAMEKANEMTVAAGSLPAKTVSLRGSNRATDAFQACARELHAGNRVLTNPFQ